MFWWGRVNSIIAILAFGGSALLLLSGMWAETIALWVCIIVLRLCLVIANVLHTAVVGRPLFYDTRIDFERAQDRVVDDE